VSTTIEKELIDTHTTLHQQIKWHEHIVSHFSSFPFFDTLLKNKVGKVPTLSQKIKGKNGKEGVMS
jgi:hypothetical protein